MKYKQFHFKNVYDHGLSMFDTYYLLNKTSIRNSSDK
jgi:hypothetical protein